MNDEIQDLTDRFIKEMRQTLDRKLREVCEIWGINPDDHDEVGRRCEIKHYTDAAGVDHGKYVYVDGFLVMKYFHPEPITFDAFGPPRSSKRWDQIKIGYTFDCSEIAKPEDFGTSLF